MTKQMGAEELGALSRAIQQADAKHADFLYAQSSDETGEYYTRQATLVFDGQSKLDLLQGISDRDDWSKEDFDALCAAFNALPRLLDQIEASNALVERLNKTVIDQIGWLDTMLSGARFTKPETGRATILLESVERRLAALRTALSGD